MAQVRKVRVYEQTQAHDAKGNPVRSKGELRHEFTIAEDQPDVRRREIKRKVLAMTGKTCSVSECTDGTFTATVVKMLEPAKPGRRA